MLREIVLLPANMSKLALPRPAAGEGITQDGDTFAGVPAAARAEVREPVATPRPAAAAGLPVGRRDAVTSVPHRPEPGRRR